MSTDNHATAQAILLSAHDAKRCARRVHNEHDPAIERVPWEVPAALQMLFDVGAEFEETVFAELRARLGERCADLSDVRGKSAVIAATVQAMDAGVEVILGGWLPDDLEGGRKGRPDLLLRVEGGYVPGDVKGHKVVKARAKGVLTCSTFDQPTERIEVVGYGAATSGKLGDYLQLAHYWRMLEAAGRAPGTTPTGAIIGTDVLADLAEPGHVLTWLDLAAPYFETYSRSKGTTRRTALERYDHEQSFRLRVAQTAAAGEPALVEPIFTAECNSCPWYDHCRGIAPDDSASAQITSGRLSVREWRALADAGIVTISDLADLDIEAASFQDGYLPEVANIKDPLGRLATAVRRAGMIRDGNTLERETTGPIEVPRADVEIDFDIEWDPAHHVYLWGALVNRAGESTYHPVVAWRDLDDADALELAQEFATWLRAQISEADAAEQSLLVYHYADPEPRYLAALLGDGAADLLERFVDLLSIIRRHYFGLDGLGVKKVAPAFGFEWRDDDPGGLQSQLWLIEARSDPDEVIREAARRRILAYNEDDVRATAAIREGLRSGVTA